MEASATRLDLESVVQSISELEKLLDPYPLLPQLVSSRLLGEAEARELELQQRQRRGAGTEAINRKILRIVRENGEEGLRKLVSALSASTEPRNREAYNLLRKRTAGAEAVVGEGREEGRGKPGQQQLDRDSSYRPFNLLPSVLADILDRNRGNLQGYVTPENMDAFLVSLTRAGVIDQAAYLSIAGEKSISRHAHQQRVGKLISRLKEAEGGVELFCEFVRCLQRDTNPSHTQLGKLFLQEVDDLLKKQTISSAKEGGASLLTQRELVGLGNLLRTPPRPNLNDRLRELQHQLADEIKLPALMIHLRKYRVLEEGEMMKIQTLPPMQREEEFLSMLVGKPPATVEAFVKCLRENPKHKHLAELFEMKEKVSIEASSSTSTIVRPTADNTVEKLAVLMCMEEYLHTMDADEMNGTSHKGERTHDVTMSSWNPLFDTSKEKLINSLKALNFYVLDFGGIIGSWKTRGQGEWINPKSFIPKQFKNRVAAMCTKSTAVFILVSGIAFPIRYYDGKSERYTSALLLQGEPEKSRAQSKCVSALVLQQCIELLPTPNVVVVADCHMSPVVSYQHGKPKDFKLVKEPWKPVTRWNDRAVIFSIAPSPPYLKFSDCKKDDEKTNTPFGYLTHRLAQALESLIQRSDPDPPPVSHRMLYEAISFRWFGNGRDHNHFQPTMQGDVDREFFGEKTFPYQHVFRAYLLPRESSSKSPRDRFDLNQLHIPTGRMSGLIQQDEVEVFHVCFPEVNIKGKVKKVHQLSATVVIEDQEALSNLIDRIYRHQVESYDRTTEFMFVRKRLQMYSREKYAVFCSDLQDEDTKELRHHISECSTMLLYRTSQKDAHLLVRMEGGRFVVEDISLVPDISYQPRVRNIGAVMSMLERMAWFKYLKHEVCRPQKNMLFHQCHVTCGKELLSTTPAFRYKISQSSQKLMYPPTQAIVHKTDQFWEPVVHLSNPYIDVDFLDSNYLITAVEVKGDSKENKFLSEGSLFYQKTVLVQKHTGPKGAGPSHEERYELRGVCQDNTVQFVYLEPIISQAKDFILNLQFYGVVGSEVTVINKLARITRGKVLLRPQDVFVWTGESLELEFFAPQILTSLKVIAPDGEKLLGQFELKLRGPYQTIPLPQITSSFPRKCILPRPFLSSYVKLSPTQDLSAQPVKLQIQLYGNRHGQPIETIENDLLQFYFFNESNTPLYIYVICLEETGMVKFLFSDMVYERREYKKLLRTTFPVELRSTHSQILDTYRVLVSTRLLYLEPFFQRPLSQHYSCKGYDVCSLGQEIPEDKELVDTYEFSVRVTRSAES